MCGLDTAEIGKETIGSKQVIDSLFLNRKMNLEPRSLKLTSGQN